MDKTIQEGQAGVLRSLYGWQGTERERDFTISVIFRTQLEFNVIYLKYKVKSIEHVWDNVHKSILS